MVKLNTTFVVGFIVLFFIYIVYSISFMINKINGILLNNEIDNNSKMSGLAGDTSLVSYNNRNIKTMAWEQALLKKIGVKASEALIFLYIERLILIVGFIILLFIFKGLALAGIIALIAEFYFQDLYKKMIYNSGITNIPQVVSFINFFIPQLDSGVSADQAFTIYIETNASEELSDYYKHKDDETYRIPPHLKQIVEIYQLALYNENSGSNDYSYIIQEMGEDINQKSIYYNKFLGAINTIKPIGLAFTFGVPICIYLSYTQTSSFWNSFFGWIVALIIALLYVLYKFFIYKLQENTVKKIF